VTVGDIVETGVQVVVRYTGWLEGEEIRGTLGNVFDENVGHDMEPLEFTVGEDEVLN
jgi:FKBP-type peptidyl-prolyl cis-trans isomerase